MRSEAEALLQPIILLHLAIVKRIYLMIPLPKFLGSLLVAIQIYKHRHVSQVVRNSTASVALNLMKPFLRQETLECLLPSVGVKFQGAVLQQDRNELKGTPPTPSTPCMHRPGSAVQKGGTRSFNVLHRFMTTVTRIIFYSPRRTCPCNLYFILFIWTQHRSSRMFLIHLNCQYYRKCCRMYSIAPCCTVCHTLLRLPSNRI